MKIKKIFLALVLMLAIAFSLTSCAFKAFEKEIHVVFEVEGEYFGSGIVTQFDSVFTPDLPESYIPAGYKFLGWTPYELSKVQPTDPNLKSKYVGAGKMVHYYDVADYVEDTTVVLSALMFDKADIPVEYHYAVIAWYNKEATSGVTQAKMDTLLANLKLYLKAEGVSDSDINTIVIRGYDGNVGTSTGHIVDDDDVDIMFGWGSAENVTTTGVLKPEMIKETESYEIVYNGLTKNRTIHRLTDKETAIKVMEWLKSDECRNLFK